MWAACLYTSPLSIFLSMCIHKGQMLTGGVFINHSPFYLFSAAILPDWLVTEGLRQPPSPPTPTSNAGIIGISPAWLVLCWWIQIQISKLGPLHPFINSHLLPSFSTPLFSIPQLPERKGKTSLCSQLVQNVPVLLRGPGAGLGITWTSGLCPQRSRFRPALPASKDRSLSSWGESVAQLPPPHPAMGLCGLVALSWACAYSPAVDLAQPLTSGLHYYKVICTCHTSLPLL